MLWVSMGYGIAKHHIVHRNPRDDLPAGAVHCDDDLARLIHSKLVKKRDEGVGYLWIDRRGKQNVVLHLGSPVSAFTIRLIDVDHIEFYVRGEEHLRLVHLL